MTDRQTTHCANGVTYVLQPKIAIYPSILKQQYNYKHNSLSIMLTTTNETQQKIIKGDIT